VSPHEEDHELPYECVKHFNDLIHEEDPCEDEALVYTLPFDEYIQTFVPTTHQEDNIIKL
jgi:hypothetical protein